MRQTKEAETVVEQVSEPEAPEEPGGRRRSGASPFCHTRRKNVYKTMEDLDKVLVFPPQDKATLKKVESLYHVRVPEYYLSLITDPANPHDPIRLQSVPHAEELNDAQEADIDPLGEQSMSPVGCLVHRYPDRALLLVTGRCFMYCRHCTRKRLWKDQGAEPSLNDIQQAVSYIQSRPQIREIIVSGGDPLTLATERLDCILDMLKNIPHLEVIRIGTRTPVVFPQRIDESLCRVLERYPNLWINVQFNHPKEVTREAARACRRLQKCGIPLSNQSVLLKGVNDDAAVMKELCQKLQSIRIRPYYLFQCDPVVGASHFRTNVYKGIEILEQMRGHTSGMCIPTFVVDGTDGKGKIPLGPNYLVSQSPEKLTLRNYQFQTFEYINPNG